MAEIKVYKMYATGTVSADAAATIDVQEDGEICSILLDTSIQSGDNLSDGVASEVSFASVSGFGTNDTRASLIGARVYQAFLTSGGGPIQKTTFITFAPNGIPVAAGERLYMHVLQSGTFTWFSTAWVYFCLPRALSLRGRVGRRVR